jgi:hypothetical protein
MSERGEELERGEAKNAGLDYFFLLSFCVRVDLRLSIVTLCIFLIALPSMIRSSGSCFALPIALL